MKLRSGLFRCLVLAAAGPLLAQSGKYELPAEQRTGVIRRIFVLCHSHLDIGFTRPPDEVARNYKDNIDSAIRIARQNPDFRWTIESAWMLAEWLRRTDDEKLIEELGSLLRDGRMELGAGFANMHSGLMGAEESNRLVYLAERFRRRFGIKADMALQNDVPGFTWAYPRILAGSGVRRLITGLNLFIGGGNNLGVSKNPFYWIGPDGSRVLTYFTYDSYVEGYRWKLGRKFPLEELEKIVPRRLAWLERNGYKYDTYLLMASPGDNVDPRVALGTLERMREWNARHPELPMRMATPREFFDALTSKYGDEFPSASGDATGHWEIVKLRVPEAAARMRQASNDLPAAETLAAIAAIRRKAAFPRFDFADAWRALLAFHEHTADAGAGWPGYFSRQDTDWNNIAHYAAALEGFSNTEQLLFKSLVRVAAPELEYEIPEPMASRATSASVVVYNGLSWPRGGPVRVERLPIPLREGPLSLTDAVTGEQVPYEEVPGTKRHIIFFAGSVPAVGYRVYRLDKGGPAPAVDSRPFPLEVSWDAAGRITSIADRASRRELVHSTPERPFGSLWTSRGRGRFEQIESVPAQVQVHDGPVERRIEIARKGSALPLTVVTLYRDAPYADLQFDVDLNILGDGGGENGGMRYAIALPLPAGEQMFLSGAGFVMRVPQDILPGGGAAQFTPGQFWHQRQSGAWGVTLANRDAFVLRPDHLFLVAAEGLTTRTRDEGVQRLARTEPRSSPVQSFRFRIAVQEEQAWQWVRFGAECNLPLRAYALDSSVSPPGREFFQISDSAVQLLAFKPAEFRPGWYVIRLQEIGGKGAAGVKLSTPFEVPEALRANLVEEPSGGAADLSNISLKPWETLTVLARLRTRQ